MRNRNRYIAVFAFVACSVVSVPLHAAPIVWELFGVTFSDGASASGTFTYDAGADVYSAWDISVTPGILTAYNYLPGVDGGFMGIHSALQVDFVAFPAATSGRYLRLSFANPLTDAGGTDLLLTDDSGFECDNCNVHRFITAGGAVSIPEPSNLMLVSAVLGFAGLLRRRGRYPIARVR